MEGKNGVQGDIEGLILYSSSNNYRDLVDEIAKADTSCAPPLSPTKTAVIAAVAGTFPTNKMIYDASHLEAIWRQCPTGAIIPYSSAAEITEMPKIKDLV
ncbi:hypothetical protein [Desulfonatronum parangueonense]